MDLGSEADADDEDLFFDIFCSHFTQSSNPWLRGVVDGGRTARDEDGIETMCRLN